MIPLVKTYIAPKEEMMPAIEKVLYSGYTAVGATTAEFERKFSEYINNPYVVALNSGTAALHIAFELCGIKAGDEVISTPMTAEPTNTTILNTGAKVVWGDVDENNGLLDPDDVEKKITDKTKAIVLVHYAGMVCDMDRFIDISAKYDIPIVEDCAHALGSKYNGKSVGYYSDYGCYSFQSIKHMTTVDGGALCIGEKFTDEEKEHKVEQARRLRFFGLSKKVSRLNNDIVRAGYKFGMNNVNAQIGLIQLNHIDEVIGTYISNGHFYDRELKDIDGISLVKYNNNTEPSYWLYTLMVDNRNDFIRMLEEEGISASVLHHRNDTHSCFADSKCELPGMEKWYGRFVHIPCGWWVDQETREKIVETIKKGW